MEERCGINGAKEGDYADKEVLSMQLGNRPQECL